MQHGFVQRICRKRSADVWQFRWSETHPDGKRRHHKKVLGTVEQFADEHSARRAVVALITCSVPDNASPVCVPNLFQKIPTSKSESSMRSMGSIKPCGPLG